MFSKEEKPEHYGLDLMLLEEERDRAAYQVISNPFGNITTNVCAIEL
jgi:hypothetical protein